MKGWSFFDTVLVTALVAVPLMLALGGFKQYERNSAVSKSCREQHGVPVDGRGGIVCITPGAVLFVARPN